MDPRDRNLLTALFVLLYNVECRNVSVNELYYQGTESSVFEDDTFPKPKNVTGATIRLAVLKNGVNSTEIQDCLNITTDSGQVVSRRGKRVPRDCWMTWATLLDLRFLFRFKYKVYSLLDGDNGLLNDVVDVTLYLRTMTPSRKKDFTLLQPVRSAQVKIFFERPSINSIQNLHLKPFHSKTWYTLLAVWVIFYLVAKCFYHLQGWRHLQGLHPPAIACYTVGVLTGRCTCPKIIINRRRMAVSILTFTGAWFGMMVQMFYGDSILSALATETSPISSGADLLYYGYQLSTHARSEILQNYTQGLVGAGNHFDRVYNDHQISHLSEGKRATLAYTNLFIQEAERQNYTAPFICNTLASVNIQGQLQLQSTMMLQKNSRFKESFNYGITRLKEIGLHARYFNEILEFRKATCHESGNTGVHDTVGFGDIQIPFGIVMGGLLMSGCVWIMEKLWMRNRREPCVIQ